MTVLSCRLYNLKKDLNPEDKEFLSIVRYIISKEERKDFLELPDSEKEKFKEEFWRIRNPDPDSEWNEFKEQYFDRIEEANRLFRGGIPGWLQDRGRIYILFGPPTERSIYPMQSSSKPMEVWLYGSFPVIFVDEMGTGDFKLVTLNVVHLFELNKAQMASQMDPRPKEKFFDFQLSTKKIEGRGILVTIEIDLKNLWLIEREGRLETSFELSVEVLDTNDAKVWEDEKDYPFSILEEDLEKEEKFVIEYPLILERGKYTLNLSLLNKAGEKTIRKSLKIEI
jgi:GWxTD domain-containing protein